MRRLSLRKKIQFVFTSVLLFGLAIALSSLLSFSRLERDVLHSLDRESRSLGQAHQSLAIAAVEQSRWRGAVDRAAMSVSRIRQVGLKGMREIRRQRWSVVSLAVVCGFGGLAMVRLLTSRIMAPIERVTRGACRIGQGDLDHRIEIDTDDELGDLAREFNRMAAEVATSRAELDHNVQVRTAELRAANEELRKASRLKSEFLANMSHELRTPLNSIIGFTRIVARKTDGVIDSAQTENLKKVLHSANLLLDQINEILDLAKIEAGRVTISRESFEIEPFLKELAGTVKPLVEAGGNSLTLDFASDLGVATTDRGKLRQIVLNLLSNASKFTKGGRLWLRCRRAAQGRLRIEVEDTGIGIAADQLDIIFEEFRQADGSTSREYGGTGLGLSIAKRLTEMLGGRVEVRSTPSIGSMFAIELPIKPLAELDTSQPCDEQPSLDVPPVADEPRRPVVLHIDDDPHALYLVKEELKDANYEVVGVRNGMEGIVLARRLQPACILLDVMLPAMDGWDIIAELKRDPATSAIPVVFLSMVENQALGKSMGASAYLLKPVTGETILGTLERVTEESSRSSQGSLSPATADDTLLAASSR